MSDFNLFEAHEASGEDRRREAAKAGDKLADAISDVRGRFGSFLFQASDRGDFEDRVALCKDDMIRAVDAHLMPVTGTMRRVVRAMRDDWQQRTAVEDHPGHSRHQDPDWTAQGMTAEEWNEAGRPGWVTNNPKTKKASDEVLVPEGDFHGYLDDVAPRAESQAGENFVVTGPVNEHTGDPADTDFAKQSRRRAAMPGSQSPDEAASARYVLDFMRARGVDQLNVDDENPNPSYQRDFDDEEELDDAVAWVPQGVIYNGPRGDRDPWNPVIRAQDLEGWLARNAPAGPDKISEHRGSRRAAGTEQFRSRFKGITTPQLAVMFDEAGDSDEGDELFEELHYRMEENDRDAAAAISNDYNAEDPDWTYETGYDGDDVAAGRQAAKGKGKGKAKAKKPKPQSEYGDAFDNMFGEPMGLLDDMIDSVKLRDRSKESRRRYVAGGDPLGQAAEAITQELQEQAEQFQQAIEPLQQALQAVDYAQQVQDAQHPMNVQPGEGTVQVIPERNPVPQQIPQGGPEVMPEQAPLEDPNDPYGSQAAQAQQVQARRRRRAGYGAKSYDIAGYTYDGDNFEAADLVEYMIAKGELSPGARGMDIEDVLNQHAGVNGIDREDERSFDSSEHPKVIFNDQLDEEHDSDWYSGFRQSRRRRAYDRMAAEHRLEDVPSSEHPWGMTADEPPYPTHPYRGKGGDGLSWKPAKGDDPEHWARPAGTELPNRRSKDSRRRGAGRIDTLRQIVDSHQHQKVDGMLVDVQTANLLLKCYEGVSTDKARSAIETAPLERVVDMAWKVTKQGSRGRRPLGSGRQAAGGGVKVVHNKMLGGWYVVRGPHQTPLSGRFDSKEEAEASLRRKSSRTSSLNDEMEFGRPISVGPNGEISESDQYAPEAGYLNLDADGQSLDDEVEGLDGWELLKGFTGQQGYNGPVMHPSEFIGGGLERHIRENPGHYVAIPIDGLGPDSEYGESESVGWGVAYKPHTARRRSQASGDWGSYGEPQRGAECENCDSSAIKGGMCRSCGEGGPRLSDPKKWPANVVNRESSRRQAGGVGIPFGRADGGVAMEGDLDDISDSFREVSEDDIDWSGLWQHVKELKAKGRVDEARSLENRALGYLGARGARGRRPLGERRASGVSEHTRRRQEWADAHPGEERGWANGGYSGTVDDALRAMSDDERDGVYSRHPWLETPKREAARSVTLIGGGNTHRPEGWKWDRHLSAFTAHQARLFSCSCGDELDMPGYRHCRCGKVWNGYAVASGGDTRTAHADTYLVREVPVRKDVILAGRRGAAVRAANRRLAGEGDPQWYNDRVDSLGKKPTSRQKLDKARRDLKHWVGTNGGSYGKAQADKLKRLVEMYENDVARAEDRQAGRLAGIDDGYWSGANEDGDCVACKGTGKGKDGEACWPCHGVGHNDTWADKSYNPREHPNSGNKGWDGVHRPGVSPWTPGGVVDRDKRRRRRRSSRSAGAVKDQWIKDREDAGEDPQWTWPSEVGQDSPKVSQSPVDWHRRDSGGKWTPPGVPAKKGRLVKVKAAACTDCGVEHVSEEAQYVCPSCGYDEVTPSRQATCPECDHVDEENWFDDRADIDVYSDQLWARDPAGWHRWDNMRDPYD